MAEYIERNNLIDYLTKATGHKATCDGCCDIDCVDCIRDEVIKNLPTADVVEVVRCCDCKHSQENPDINNTCYLTCKLKYGIRGTLDPTDFCSYGKRKEVANNG